MLDLTDYPADYTFGPLLSKELGVYVKLADFTEHNGLPLFRLIMDPNIPARALEKLLRLRIKDPMLIYVFRDLESIQAPVIDELPHRSPTTTYLRATFEARDPG